MDAVVPIRIQIISIVGSLLFLVVIGRLIVRGRLREEYAIVWLACTIVLLLLSVWRNGLEVLAASLGVFYPPSLLFLGACFAITIFLVHLSVVVTKLQKQNKILAQELALMRNELQASKQPTV
jgi:hypothetical protein